MRFMDIYFASVSMVFLKRICNGSDIVVLFVIHCFTSVSIWSNDFKFLRNVLGSQSQCTILEVPSWSWSYNGWIYNYLCHQCLSPLKLWVRIPFMARF